MNALAIYSTAFWGIWVVLLTWWLQWFIASGAKAKLPGAVPGKIDESLSHESFVFRSHRTFLNSLENVPIFLGLAFLAIFSGASEFWTAILVWVFALARLGHMVLYYALATEINPSPRTYFFLLGVLASAGLLVLCAITLS